jgi:O-antigen/teichoic acid export membrane protein
VAKLVSWHALVPKYSHQVIVRVKQYLSQMAWISLLAMLNKQLDKLLISLLMPIGALGIYSFAFLTVSKLTLMADALVQAAFPAFSELHRRDDRRQLHARFFMLQDVLVYGLVPLFAAIAFLALPLFSLLMNEEKSLSLLLPILLLSLAFYLNGTVRLLNAYVSACGKPFYILRSVVLTMILVTPATIALIYWSGLNGAGASWLIASLVGAGSMVPMVYGRELQVPMGLWLLPVLKAMSAGAAIYSLAWWGIAACSAPTDIVSYTSAFMFASFIYIAFALNLSDGGLRNGALAILPGLKVLILPWRRGK